MVNFPARIPDCESHSLALLDSFISSDARICSTMAFPPLGNSNHVVVSVSINFPLNSKRDAPFHHIACDYSYAYWDGLRDHLRDFLWQDIIKLSASAASEFCEWVQFGIDAYIPYCKYQVKAPHLHSFRLLGQLSLFKVITFFVFATRINLLNRK